MTTIAAIGLALLFAQGAPPPALPSAATGSIEGVVVSFDTGDPIGRAVVELRRTNGQRSMLQFSPDGAILAEFLSPTTSSMTVNTAADGKFTFQKLQAGEYRLYSTRNGGYIPGEYGQRSPAGTGTPLTLGASQKVSGVRLAMAPTSSISGRILDLDGDPVVYGRVQLLRTAYHEGQRILVIAQWALTDDHGEYRLYALPPGQYYVAAEPYPNRSTRGGAGITPTALASRFASLQNASSPMVTRRVLDTGVVVEETWMPIFYPGTPESGSAQLIDLRMGENRQAIDISLAASGAAVRHVKGVVIDGATGSPAPGATVRLVPRSQLMPSIVMPSGNTDGSGHFDVQGALPSSYSLFVSGPVTGFMILDVGETDVENLKVVGSTGIDIPWKVAMDGSNDSALGRNLRIVLIRNPVVMAGSSGGIVMTAGWSGLPSPAEFLPSEAGPSGGFVLRGVGLGDYRVNVSGLPRGAYVKSIRTGRTDVLKDGLRVTSVFENPMEIVLGNDSGTLGGRVVGEHRDPAANVTVVLVPNPPLRSRTDLYYSGATDSNGRFQFEGIAPGTYELFAWEEVTAGAWHDPDFIRTQAGRSASVMVRQGGNEPLEVAVIPWSNVR